MGGGEDAKIKWEFKILRNINLTRSDLEEFEKADAELKSARSTLAYVLGDDELFDQSCGVCFTPERHSDHKIRDTTEGPIHKAFHCGRRKPKTENLR